MTRTSRSSVFISRKSEGDDKWKKGRAPVVFLAMESWAERWRGMRFFCLNGVQRQVLTASRGERGEPQSAAPKEDVMRLHG